MRSVLCWLAVCVVCIACGPKEEKLPDQSGNTEDISSAEALVAPSTRQMAQILARAFGGINPEKTPYHTNQARINYFQQQAQSGNIQIRLNAASYYANELLSGGYPEQAIEQLEPLIKELRSLPNTEVGVLHLSRLLAIAYLRLGEQANCLNQRNQASCIVPIAPEAQYQMTQGSETAMRICLEILENTPDEETVWILNLAAMTIGQYPDGVPPKWRIAESFFTTGDFPRFTDISHRVGIRGLSLAGGVCVEDFDNDGWLDILTSSWGEYDPLVLWKNDGQGGFVNASGEMGLDGITGGLNMIHADINNDGLADVFIMRGAWLFGEGKIPNSLLLNLGNGQFRDITQDAGLLTFAPTQNAVFADFNLDGWIDLFVGNESTTDAVFQNELFLNRGNGTFVNAIRTIPFSTIAFLKGCAAGDINNDGWPDLYLSNYKGPNMLLLNRGVNDQNIPQFENITVAAGVAEPEISFPVWFWDFNNDGWEDIFVSSYGDGSLAVARDFVRNAQGKALGGHPRIYQNTGKQTFKDVSAQMGMTQNIFTMGCNFGDLDADGYLDFYLGTGNPEFSSVVPNKMFHNVGGKRFEDITGPGGFGQIQKGHAVGFGDLDHDGDEDFFQSLGGALAGDLYEDVFFENPIGQDKSWIVLQLQGVESNRAAIGARVKVSLTTPRGKQAVYRTVSTGGSFGSSSLQLEIGLGDATAIDAVEITWPSRSRTQQVFQNLTLNRYVEIIEGKGDPVYRDVQSVAFRK